MRQKSPFLSAIRKIIETVLPINMIEMKRKIGNSKLNAETENLFNEYANSGAFHCTFDETQATSTTRIHELTWKGNFATTTTKGQENEARKRQLKRTPTQAHSNEHTCTEHMLRKLPAENGMDWNIQHWAHYTVRNSARIEFLMEFHEKSKRKIMKKIKFTTSQVDTNMLGWVDERKIKEWQISLEFGYYYIFTSEKRSEETKNIGRWKQLELQTIQFKRRIQQITQTHTYTRKFHTIRTEKKMNRE